MRGVIIILVLPVLLVASPAKAQGDADSHWVRRQLLSSCEFWGNCSQYFKHRHWREKYEYTHKRYYQPAPRVYAYERREQTIWDEDRSAERGHCLATSTTVLSDPHKSEDRSRDDAAKRWMAAIQWNAGGAYMNFAMAADKLWRCGPSDPQDTNLGRVSRIGGKIKAGIKQFTSGTQVSDAEAEGYNIRCQLWARPCRAAREADIGSDINPR
jgi:hypothetical protein